MCFKNYLFKIKYSIILGKFIKNIKEKKKENRNFCCSIFHFQPEQEKKSCCFEEKFIFLCVIFLCNMLLKMVHKFTVFYFRTICYWHGCKCHYEADSWCATCKTFTKDCLKIWRFITKGKYIQVLNSNLKKYRSPYVSTILTIVICALY